MWRRIKPIWIESKLYFDGLLLIAFFPVVWSFITSTFFLKHAGADDPYIIINYPIVYYGLIIIVTVSMILSLFSRYAIFKQIFYLVLVFGGIYSAVNGYQITHEPDITVGMFLYSTFIAMYGFIQTSEKIRKVKFHVQSFHN